MRTGLTLTILLALVTPCAGAQDSAVAVAGRREAPPIADNSFLLEEAYNQEARVVQHISAFHWIPDARVWTYTFTQEWPVGGQRHQASFTLPLERTAGAPSTPTGLGDIALNYRYQVVGTEGRVSAAPRLSLLLPTGSETRGLGAGGWGLQLNVPVSVALGEWLVAHGNGGLTATPSARNAAGAEAATVAWNIGGSLIGRLRPTLNALVELVWMRSEVVVGPGATAAAESLILNPGIRWAHNVASGLQIVPGVAVPIGMGPSAGERGILLYLSFEHPF